MNADRFCLVPESAALCARGSWLWLRDVHPNLMSWLPS